MLHFARLCYITGMLAGSVIHYHRERVVILSLICLAVQVVLFDTLAPGLRDVCWPVSGALLVCWAPAVTAVYTPVVNLFHRAWVFSPLEMVAVLCFAALELIWPVQVLLTVTPQ